MEVALLRSVTSQRTTKILTNVRTWGCPVYILDAENQSGTIKHTGIYLGHSLCHTGSVSLVLSLQIGMVISQFHVVYNDEFSTVPYLSTAESPPNWLDLLRHSTERSSEEQSKSSYQWLHPITPENNVTSAPKGASTSSLPDELPDTDIVSELHQSAERSDMFPSTLMNLDTFNLYRSMRIKALPSCTTFYGMLILAKSTFVLSAPSLVEYSANCFQSRLIRYNDFLDRNFDGTANKISSLAWIYLSSQSNNKTYTLKEMLKEPDKHKFVKAMELEVASMFKAEI